MSAEHIAATLETEIVEGRFRPGEELKQGEIAKRFAISRIPVRDALQLLASRGMISLVPNRRARVISLEPAEISEIYDLRVLLETDCLCRAINLMTEADLNAIEIAFAHSSIDAVTNRWADGDWAFHQSLYLPADRPRQLKMIEELRRTCRIHIAGYGVLPAQTKDWLKDHEDILSAVRNRDKTTAQGILKRHINDACTTLLSAWPNQNNNS